MRTIFGRTERLELMGALDEGGADFRNWHLDTHRPEIVLLQRHVREATARHVVPGARLERPAELCRSHQSIDATEASDHLNGALGVLDGMMLPSGGGSYASVRHVQRLLTGPPALTGGAVRSNQPAVIAVESR
ncbi:hypothetical protein ACIOEW_38620 [Streptomyces sp. NPDC087901]|uniref:hypothetical protein n=1 Tax=Streptomyces sp. NPDC087901 TaxID=3365818 RepID=UPI0037FA4027